MLMMIEAMYRKRVAEEEEAKNVVKLSELASTQAR